MKVTSVIIVVSDNRQEALELIESALNDTYNDTVSTKVLLLKCQRIIMLLDSRQENEWIWKELEGYEIGELLPKYRIVTLRGNIRYVKIIGGTQEEQLMCTYQLKGKELDWTFQIIEPCSFLEISNEKFKLKDTFEMPYSKKKPASLLLGTMTITKPIEITLEAPIPISTLRIISSAIRTRIHEFLVSQKSTLILQPLLQGIFDDTMNLITSKLTALDPDLLEELRKNIEKLQSMSELDWRSIADSCRTIIQRFTDSIYLEEMVPDGEDKPDHNQTRNKCRQIAVWALSQFNAKLDDSPEGSRIERLPSYLDDYYEMIIRSVEKVKHKDTKTLKKDEVDRVVLYTILWLADMIQLLTRAKYPWI